MKAKRIMVQGTMSNAGKSLLVGGLCRIFKQDGFHVAPFKSQNMALNSFITKEGMEMGRAQVMQAEAAGIEPHIHMNPILLKPTSDSKSQVIVNGKSIGNQSAADYFGYKRQLVPHIQKAFAALTSEYEVVVLEGAGSPAEINLKQEDIVNMGMAEMADAPVLLVGDIDRGGVFASLYGTILLLEEKERARIRGIIINKFRGDVNILKPGLAMLEELTQIPVVGVVPYTHLDIDDEDSLSQQIEQKQAKSLLDIAVIRLPRISNFTDFAALGRSASASVRYVERVAEWGEPDLLIVPGTKNTMGDLKWLRQNGLEAQIKKHAAQKKPIIGICGGFQMLGKNLADPLNTEEGGEMQGMGLLPMSTVFEAEKVRTQARGIVHEHDGMFSCLAGCEIQGYEIHMGRTRCDLPSFSTIECGGVQSEDGAVWGNVLGTYVHGVFDSTQLCNALLRMLLDEKGYGHLPLGETPEHTQYKEAQYDKLADLLRNSLDMNAIYKILEGEA